MSAMLKFDFKKKKKKEKENIYIFQEKIIQITQKRHNFARDNYIFPKTRANNKKQWTHYSALKRIELDFVFRVSCFKRVKIFHPLSFCNCLNVKYASLGEKKNEIGCAVFR